MSAPLTPSACRPAPAVGPRTTPASAHAREQRMLRNYRSALYGIDQDSDALLVACFGPRLQAALLLRDAPRKPAERKAYEAACKLIRNAEERLDHDVPDLLQKLRWDEQAEAEALLSEARPDLPQLVGYVLKQERKLLQREDDPRLLLNDDWRLKAAGLGRLSREAYGRPLGEPLVLTPDVPRKPGATRAAHRRRPVRRGLHQHPQQLSFWP